MLASARASLYLVHVAAISHGWKQPYVEVNAQVALVTLDQFYPTGIGLAFGVCLRVWLARYGLLRRIGGPPVRLTPRTMKGLIGAIAGIAVALGFLRWNVMDRDTIYSAGYRESNFFRVREGMTEAQVIGLLGPPLKQVQEWSEGTQNWIYSSGISGTSNYWRRWIFIKDGKVERVIQDYWWD